MTDHIIDPTAIIGRLIAFDKHDQDTEDRAASSRAWTPAMRCY